MGNSAGISKRSENPPLNVDLIISNWAQNKLRKKKHGTSSKMQVSEIKWDRVMIKHQVTTYAASSNGALPGSSGPSMRSAQTSDQSAAASSTHLQILHETEKSLENKSSQEVSKMYETEETTRSMVNFSLDESINFSPGFQLFPPHDLAQSTKMAAFKMAGDQQKHTFTEHRTWKANKPVCLRPWSRVKCHLAVEKYAAERRFKHNVYTSGELHVVVQLGNGEVRSVSGDVADIFRGHQSRDQQLQVYDHGVKFQVQGCAVFDYGITEQVMIGSEESLDDNTIARGKAEEEEEERRQKENKANAEREKEKEQNGAGAMSGFHGEASVPLAACAISLADHRDICTVIIPKLSRLPAVNHYTHTSNRYYRDISKFRIYQGSHTEAVHNRHLGELVLKKSEHEVADIRLTFELDAEGRLRVAAKDWRSGEQDSFSVRIRAECNLVLTERRY